MRINGAMIVLAGVILFLGDLSCRPILIHKGRGQNPLVMDQARTALVAPPKAARTRPSQDRKAARQVVHRSSGARSLVRRVGPSRVRITPASLRSGESAIITVEADVRPGWRIRWRSASGVIGGEGLRVNFTPNPGFIGSARIHFEAGPSDRSELAGQFSIEVGPPWPKLVLHQVDDSRPGRITVRGRAEGLQYPENHRVAAYVHADIYYKLRGNHVFSLDDAGEFQFSTGRGPSLDRLVVHLIEKGVDPNGPEHCQNLRDRVPGQCTGHFDQVRGSGARLPLRMDVAGSLAFASYPFRGSRRHGNPQIQFLLNHFSPTPITKGAPTSRLIRSYGNNDQLYLYDQALAVLAFAHAGEKAGAQRVLDAVQYLQIRDQSHRDGSWYYSYYGDGSSIYPDAPSHGPEGKADGYTYGDRRVSGAIAWVAMALNAYRLKFNDQRYDDMWHRVMAYLVRARMPARIAGVESQPVRFQQVDLPRTVWNESTVAAVEHNLDAYSALYYYARLSKKAEYQEIALSIRRFVESLWVPKLKGFYAGFVTSTGKPNTEDLYLDTQTWGLLAFADSHERVERYKVGLERACELFFEPAGYLSPDLTGIPGFFDWRPRDPSQAKGHRTFVWTEGTLGYILAANVVAEQTGNRPVCTRYGVSYRAQDFLEAMDRLQDRDGGVPYATKNAIPGGFSSDASVAGTAWLYFANHGFNPFHPRF